MLHSKFRGNRPAGSLSGFYHMWAWRPSWSCDPDFVIFRSPTHKICLIGQGVSEKIFDIVDNGRTNWYTISSPC